MPDDTPWDEGLIEIVATRLPLSNRPALRRSWAIEILDAIEAEGWQILPPGTMEV